MRDSADAGAATPFVRFPWKEHLHDQQDSTVAIAIPSYLSFRDRANNSAAKANVRAAIPAVEAYNADNLGTANSAGYAGMTVSLLQAYDSAIVPTKLNIQTATSVTYCVDSTVGGKVWNKSGPGADIVSGACP